MRTEYITIFVRVCGGRDNLLNTFQEEEEEGMQTKLI